MWNQHKLQIQMMGYGKQWYKQQISRIPFTHELLKLTLTAVVCMGQFYIISLKNVEQSESIYNTAGQQNSVMAGK
jgi:hypothetical protein